MNNDLGRKQRNEYLDELKGIAILLVVLGHIIQYVYAPLNFDDNICFRVIYSFHMPLFMFLSGYTLQYTKQTCSFQWLKKRFRGLYIPFISWAIIDVLIYNRKHFIDTLLNKLIYPENGLWFLFVLGEISIVMYLAGVFSKKYLKNSDITYVIFNLILLLLPFKIFAIGLLKLHYTFFLIGYLLPKYLKKWNQKYQNIAKACASVLFVVLVPFWTRTGNPTFAPAFYNIIQELPLNEIINKIFSVFCIIYRKYLIAILGIIFIMYISRIIADKISIKVKRGLAFLGMFTMEIYAMQWYFWGHIYTGIVIVDSILSFALATLCPVIIAQIIRKNKMSAFIFSGGKLK